MPVTCCQSFDYILKLLGKVCAPKPPQKRILDIATGDVTGVVGGGRWVGVALQLKGAPGSTVRRRIGWGVSVVVVVDRLRCTV